MEIQEVEEIGIGDLEVEIRGLFQGQLQQEQIEELEERLEERL